MSYRLKKISVKLFKKKRLIKFEDFDHHDNIYRR